MTARDDQPRPDHSGWAAVLSRPCRHHAREAGHPCWTGTTRACCGRRIRAALHSLTRPPNRRP